MESLPTKVYTPSEVAQVLLLGEDEVVEMIETGELDGFSVLGGRYLRIPEQALVDLMNRTGRGSSFNKVLEPQSERPRGRSRRKRNPAQERQGREFVFRKMRGVSADLHPDTRKRFTANGRQGIVCVSTTPSGPRQGYWMGFPGGLLNSGLSTAIVAVLADREIAFVIPYESHTRAFDGLSSDKQGHKKFSIVEKNGEFYLTGRGIDPPLRLDKYLNAFDWFG